MQHLMLLHRLHRAVIVPDPGRIALVVHVRYVVALGRLLAVMVHDREQLVLFLFRLVLFTRQDFCAKTRLAIRKRFKSTIITMT